ncbi:phage tail protein [Catalinimonas sp. 4WD22]|uniref:phage tail protein n=1 Tax=Catalinimonas locisalis TaxID=3133978 RepID=UPI00310123D1
MIPEDNQDSLWPMPKFSFMVKFGAHFSASFQEVSGLDDELPPTENQQDEEIMFTAGSMPDSSRLGKVILKNGEFVHKDHFYEWYQEMKTNILRPVNVTIQLMDENNNPTLTWTLTNAWLSRITGTDLEAESSVSAIESLELRHEGITTG